MTTPRPLLWDGACAAAVRRQRQNYLQSLKEVGRQVLFTAGLTGLIHRKQAGQGFRTRDYLCHDVAETFSTSYRLGGWVHADDQESSSGIGSAASITAGLVDAIGSILTTLGCTSLVDVGCGDWNWFSKTPFTFDYTGIDIVPDVVAANRRYERPHVRFLVADAIRGPIPSADVALCREVLFHLSFAHARAVIASITKAARYLVATTDLDLWFNSDIQSGDFRRINLFRRPYSFPAPRCLIPDDRLVPARRLAVWDTASLPV